MKNVAMAVPVVGLIWMAAFGRLTLSETMWLGVRAVGLVDLTAHIIPVATATLSRDTPRARGARSRS